MLHYCLFGAISLLINTDSSNSRQSLLGESSETSLSPAQQTRLETIVKTKLNGEWKVDLIVFDGKKQLSFFTSAGRARSCLQTRLLQQLCKVIMFLVLCLTAWFGVYPVPGGQKWIQCALRIFPVNKKCYTKRHCVNPEIKISTGCISLLINNSKTVWENMNPACSRAWNIRPHCVCHSLKDMKLLAGLCVVSPTCAQDKQNRNKLSPKMSLPSGSTELLSELTQPIPVRTDVIIHHIVIVLPHMVELFCCLRENRVFPSNCET